MKLVNKDLTVISITHDVEEAYLSDRVIVLSHGKIVLNDTPEEVFKNKDILNNLNLTIPFILEFKERLFKIGINVNDKKDVKEIVKYLCQSK
jgi:energy-coupling factor transport system ATP-binding protein